MRHDAAYHTDRAAQYEGTWGSGSSVIDRHDTRTQTGVASVRLPVRTVFIFGSGMLSRNMIARPMG